VTHAETFHDVLAAQFRRAPYLLASVLVHAVVGFVLASVMLLTRERVEVPVLTVQAPPPPPAIDEPDDPPPPVAPVPVEDPTLVDLPLEADPTDFVDAGDPDQLANAPWESFTTGLNVVGIGGPPGGDHGGPPGGWTRGAPQPMEIALADALQWLADHQSPDGQWDADEFMLQDRYADAPRSDGRGSPVVDVGLTGLCVLAFLGDGSTTSDGRWREQVASGVQWLLDVQQESGLFGEEVGNPTLYNQAIATLAVCEAYRLGGRSIALKKPAQRAVGLLVRARNPYGAWRYRLEPNGDNDTSITGWMVFALKSAQQGGLAVDKGCFDGAAAWFEAITDPATGRTGYAWGEDGGGMGSLPSRPLGKGDRFPAERSEALTAVALLCRIFMADAEALKRWEDHPRYEELRKQADLLRAKPPRWDSDGASVDFYYWYYATYAMNQWGGAAWREWEKALGRALLPMQRRSDRPDNFHGSWDPADAWGEEGGRVYSTALCALMLEVYYRYAQVLGGR
jgi:hypothetical protein